MLRLALALSLLAACSSTGPRRQIVAGPWPVWHEVRPGAPAPTDLDGWRAALVAPPEVLDGGIYFRDPVCRTRFGKPRAIAAAEREGFAKCVAERGLHAGGRASAHDDTTVLVDADGFEYEAHVVDHRVDFLGFSGRGAGVPELPTIAPATLETLRTGGDPAATLAPETMAALKLKAIAAHLRICVGADGATTIAHASASPPEVVAAFTAIAKPWTFKPLVLDGAPVPACAIVRLVRADTPPPPDRIPLPPGVAPDGSPQFGIAPQTLEQLRTGGSPAIRPDDRDSVELHGVRLAGEYHVCLDATGAVTAATTRQSTGVPTYDDKVVRTIRSTWTFSPYRHAGAGVPVCANVRIIFIEH